MSTSLASSVFYPSSHSVHSLAEESEVISEVDEIKAVKRLVIRGEREVQAGNMEKSLRLFNEALEIESTCLDAIYGRALVFVETKKFLLAQQDVDQAMTLDPKNFKGYYLQALSQGGLGYHREALISLIKALQLDTNSDHAPELTNEIARMANQYSAMPEELLERIPGMEPYKKLSEVGTALYTNKKYDMSIKVLNAAQGISTNQHGITMKVLLSLANAYCALKNVPQAITHYQECLSLATVSHDFQYQTKSLVSIASLYMEMGDTHQAVVYYEKLLSLREELQSDAVDLPDYWSGQLLCALHLNLSIAYKTIGYVDKAVIHAGMYLELVSDEELQEMDGIPQGHYNLGVLYEVVGEYAEAAKHFSKYYQLSRASGNKSAIAVAYGCLGSVYGHLRNSQLAVTYHEQHLKIAESLDDKKMMAEAREQMGDTLITLEMFDEAVEVFTKMWKSCARMDIQCRITALLKLGKAYSSQKRNQYAGYYTEEARSLAADFNYTSLLTVCEFELLIIYQYSTQVKELEAGRKYFLKLLPLFEAKLSQHFEEETFFPFELVEKLHRCYTAIQNILIRLGNNKECLLYSESFKSKNLGKPLTGTTGLVKHSKANWTRNPVNLWTMEKVENVIGAQEATVIFYSLTPTMLAIWVLKPSIGIVRTYSQTTPDPKVNLNEQILELIQLLKKNSQNLRSGYKTEHRALPLEGTSREWEQKQNEKLSIKGKRKEYVKKMENEEKNEERMGKSAEKPPERKLYNLVLAPIDDLLNDLDPDDPLVIIPDGALNWCPFNSLCDFNNQSLGSRYCISVIPSLSLLEKVTDNKAEYEKSFQELDEKREESCNREAKVSGSFPPAKDTAKKLQEKLPTIPETSRLKRLSHPRQATAEAQDRALASSSEAVTMATNEAQSFGARRAVCGGNLTTLATATTTKGNIVQSHLSIPSFKQLSDHQRATVIGRPKLPEKLTLHGRTWKPPSFMEECQRECVQVAECLDVSAVMAEDATKSRFLQELTSNAILHIATLGCLQEGTLIFSPDPCEGPPKETDFLVTYDDITRVGTSAQLIVLSAGWSAHDTGQYRYGNVLHRAFLNAGAQCVVSLLWSVPSDVLNKFYFHLYTCLNEGRHVSRAVNEAAQMIGQDNRFAGFSYHTAFSVIGRDPFVDLRLTRHALLDQAVDQAEKDLIQETNKDPLNPPDVTPKVESRESLMETLQKCVVGLLANHSSTPTVIPLLLDMLDSSLKRLHTRPRKQKPAHLHDDVTSSEPSMTLLKLLGFHFQAEGAYITDPYIIFPHWNPDDLLMPVYDAVRALTELVVDPACCKAIENMLPLSQDLLSFLVDLLCLTRHASHIQLKVTDLSIKPLWTEVKTRALLSQLSFQQVGVHLTFNATPTNRRILYSLLQLMISCSVHKSTVLLHKLDMFLLGGPQSTQTETADNDLQLPSLTPLLLPRNQVRMSTPWLTHLEAPEEMDEKMKLSLSKEHLSSDYQSHLLRAKTWHQSTICPQADESLDKLTRPRSSPQKVKVIGGSSASCVRVPTNKEEELTLDLLDVNRDHAHGVLSQRMDDVMVRQKNDVRKLYLPYIHN